MGQKEVERATMFRIPNPDDIPRLTELYRIMSAESKKDGKPYILSLKVGPTNQSDPRHSGYTYVSFSRFASMEDMIYYDDVDEAHQVLKKNLKPMLEGGVTSVYTESLL